MKDSQRPRLLTPEACPISLVKARWTLSNDESKTSVFLPVTHFLTYDVDGLVRLVVVLRTKRCTRDP